jgi:hypothetical protein
MPRRVRDYRAEYAARIAKGLARGLTRSQARGHGAESKGTVGASKGMALSDLPGYVGKLKPTRSVKVMATLESGRVVEIARGKPQAMLDWWEETIGEEGDWSDLGPSATDSAVSVQVIYS